MNEISKGCNHNLRKYTWCIIEPKRHEIITKGALFYSKGGLIVVFIFNSYFIYLEKQYIKE